ncbi:MAG: adenosylhomocysteinase [Candidatus Altiarchaeota archaeon]|nr:adenosylhomocysteinase [Candidatus Altiarchaeota archaeon]
MDDIVKSGLAKIDWVSRFMPVINHLSKDFKKNQPLAGVRIAACLHLEMKTARFAMLLKEGGAEVALCPSNPLSTQDDVVAALNHLGIPTFAKHGCSREEYYEYVDKVLDIKPNIIIDDGADVTAVVHSKRKELLKDLWSVNEETTTGVTRLRALSKAGELKIPAIAVNDSMCKFLFDNQHGTGQSSWDGIIRTTNRLIAGKTVVISGYGWVGRGLALRARGLGADVIVIEPEPVRAIEATLNGYRVMTMNSAAKQGDIFVTATGNKDCLRKEHFETMKDGTMIANSGHFDVEINIEDLDGLAQEVNELKPNITEYKMKDGRRIYLLAHGRLVNLAAGDGHPAEIMDMSFAIHAIAAKYVTENKGKLEIKVHNLPKTVDTEIASIKLKAMGIETEQLTAEQKHYMTSWGEGT